jgi:type I restriction enzyme, S subunit
MSKLPENWIEPAIREVAEVNPRKDADLSVTDLVSFVPMASVDEVSGTILSPIDRPYGEVSKGFTHFRDGDVIFAKITPSMENGKSAVAGNLRNGTGMGSTEFHVFRSSGAIEPEYLWRFVRQKSFRENAQTVMSGAVGQQRVPADYLKNHSIPLPPLKEQRRIVTKVDGLTARTARARKELDRVPALIARYKSAILALAFKGDLTKDWREQLGRQGGGARQGLYT